MAPFMRGSDLESALDKYTPATFNLRSLTVTVNNGRELLAFKREVFDLYHRVSGIYFAGAAELPKAEGIDTPALDAYLKSHPVRRPHRDGQ
jgi:hypothetical protein